MSSSNMNLLIVDDDKDLLRQLEFLLEDDFNHIFTASSKDKAVELSTKDINVFLIDVRLNEKDASNTDGLEVAKKIRKKKDTAIIVMMSRYNIEKYKSLTGEEIKVDAFIRKPFTMDEFIELVNRIKRK